MTARTLFNLLDEELAKGFLQQIPSLEYAQQKRAAVAMGRLGLVTAPNQPPRLVLDSSVSNVNQCTEDSLPNVCQYPSVQAFIQTGPQSIGQQEYVGFSVDVSAAHLLLRESERGLLMLHEFGGQMFTYNTLNFGAAASSFWWGRLMAALGRLTHVFLFTEQRMLTT